MGNGLVYRRYTAKRLSACNPNTCNAADTVRLPGARIVPINSTCALRRCTDQRAQILHLGGQGLRGPWKVVCGPSGLCQLFGADTGISIWDIRRWDMPIWFLKRKRSGDKPLPKNPRIKGSYLRGVYIDPKDFINSEAGQREKEKIRAARIQLQRHINNERSNNANTTLSQFMGRVCFCPRPIRSRLWLKKNHTQRLG